MRIVVNDIAASQGGALTILRQFYSYIKDNCPDDEWIFLLGDNYLEETDNIQVLTFPEIKQKQNRLYKVSGRKILTNKESEKIKTVRHEL